MAVGRPTGLDGVAGGLDPAAGPGGDVDRPQLALPRAARHLAPAPRGHDDLPPVRRPARVVAEVSEPLDRLAGRAHDEQTPAPALGPERDPVAVGREGGVGVVARRVGRQVDRVAPAHALDEDVAPLGVAGVGGHEGERLPVRGELGPALRPGPVGEPEDGARRDRGPDGGRRTALQEPARLDRDREGQETGRAPGQPPPAGPLVGGRDGHRGRAPARGTRSGLEREGQVVRGAEAAVRALLQAVVHDALEGQRDPLVDARGLGRVRAQDRGHRLGRRLPAEGALARQHLVEHRAEGEDVGARVGLLTPHLLGRHVADRPEHGARLGAGGEGGRDAVVAARGEQARALPREAEIEHLDAPLPGHEHVVRLHVAVHDALVVRGGEGLGELQGVLGRPARGERPRGQPAAEGLPLE